MVDGIPGSSPNWRGANMKTKGRSAPAEVPPSQLGGSATGLASWGTSCTTAEAKSRRHYHQSQLAQTTAWDCLPCVDAAHKQAGSASSSISKASTSGTTSSKTVPGTSLSLALGNKEWRRHRRQVPAPPCTEKPQGKRILHTAAPQSTCKELLQDPQPPARPARTAAAASTAAAAAAAAAGASAASSCTQQCSGDKDCMQRSSSSKGGSSFSSRTSTIPASGSLSCSSSGAGSQPHQAGTAAPIAAAPGNTAAAAAAAQAGGKKKGGRVEDDPNYFRTPKDPPTLQRFADSLAQMSLGKSSRLSTVQRHEAGIRARQQAQVTAAAREVAALDAGAQPDAD